MVAVMGLEPIRYPRYYDEHSDQLSEKLSDQYECSAESLIGVGFFIIVTLLILVTGLCTII